MENKINLTDEYADGYHTNIEYDFESKLWLNMRTKDIVKQSAWEFSSREIPFPFWDPIVWNQKLMFQTSPDNVG